MTTTQEAFDAIGRSVRSDASVIQAAVRAGFLVVHVDACEEKSTTESVPDDRGVHSYLRCGQNGWYCKDAIEIQELGK